MRKEDFLIKQIDEFKEKAKQLQQLLDTKESRVQELQNVVEEREKKARSLQEILDEKQQEADSITKGVESYGKQIAQKLEHQIAELKEYFKEQEEGSGEKLEKLTASVNEISLSMEALQALVKGLSTEVEGVPSSLEKIHGSVNGIPASLEKVNASVDGLPAMIDGITSSIDSLSTSMEGIVTSMDGLSDTLENSVSRKWDEMFAKMDTMKGELSEKVHSENVKCYRNVQALVEELEQKLEQSQQEEGKPAAGLLKAAVVLGVVNLAALAGIAFYAFGLYYHLF